MEFEREYRVMRNYDLKIIVPQRITERLQVPTRILKYQPETQEISNSTGKVNRWLLEWFIEANRATTVFVVFGILLKYYF